MAQVILQNGQGLPAGDDDALSEEELAAQQAEHEAAAKTEQQRLAEEEAARAADAEKKAARAPVSYEGEITRLRDERERLRAAQAERDNEIAKLREENVRWKARQELEEEAQKKLDAFKTRSGRPDPDTDPYGAELWDLKEWRKDREAKDEERRKLEAEQSERQRAHEEQAKVFQQADKFLVDDVTNFRAEHPDYDYPAAANYVAEAYLSLYKTSGYNDAESRTMLANNLYGIAVAAKERGKSAANAIWETANKIGWKAGTPATDAAPAKTAAPTKAAADKIAALKKGQNMQGLGGKTPSERQSAENIMGMSAEEIAGLSDDDFLSLQQHPEKGKLLSKRQEELG